MPDESILPIIGARVISATEQPGIFADYDSVTLLLDDGRKVTLAGTFAEEVAVGWEEATDDAA